MEARITMEKGFGERNWQFNALISRTSKEICRSFKREKTQQKCIQAWWLNKIYIFEIELSLWGVFTRSKFDPYFSRFLLKIRNYNFWTKFFQKSTKENFKISSSLCEMRDKEHLKLLIISMEEFLLFNKRWKFDKIQMLPRKIIFDNFRIFLRFIKTNKNQQNFQSLFTSFSSQQ